jgi:hypothetical protein
MDEEWSISMKKVKLDDISGDKKKSFGKKSPKLAFLKKKSATSQYFAP